MGCDLIIRRFQEERAKARAKLPICQLPFSFATPIVVVLHHVSRVGRRGLEPRTYGLKAFPITPQTTEY
jgi:hypothetical protein